MSFFFLMVGHSLLQYMYHANQNALLTIQCLTNLHQSFSLYKMAELFGPFTHCMRLIKNLSNVDLNKANLHLKF